MVESNSSPVFIETEELSQLIANGAKNLRILDSTYYFEPEEGDQVLIYKQKHIPG
jgi:3-mercaptopyruvate sulfurtransferase SseA